MIYAVLQIIVIIGAVAFSAVQMVRRLMPQTARRFQARTAKALHLKWLEPVEAATRGCGSDDGCGGCKGCATIAALTKDLPKA